MFFSESGYNERRFYAVSMGITPSAHPLSYKRVIPFMTMKRTALLLSGLLFSVAAHTAELKIGFVNVPKLLENAPQAEKAKRDLEREFSPRDKRLVAEQKEIKQLDEKLSNEAAAMGAGERQKLEKEVVNRKREAKRLADEFREDFNIRRNEELGKLQREVLDAVQALAKEEGYDLLLTDGVIFASEAIDATEKVQRKLAASAK